MVEKRKSGVYGNSRARTMQYKLYIITVQKEDPKSQLIFPIVVSSGRLVSS